uniref:Uncharacterized protein n=1 Tax=Engystomops pustulosus TaxID=76066 RepID=A0AAV6Z0G6_ENGPU|nr:hypothetical protein GDO81_026357 [Engystomops pustulosus]
MMRSWAGCRGQPLAGTGTARVTHAPSTKREVDLAEGLWGAMLCRQCVGWLLLRDMGVMLRAGAGGDVTLVMLRRLLIFSFLQARAALKVLAPGLIHLEGEMNLAAMDNKGGGGAAISVLLSLLLLLLSVTIIYCV